MVVGFTLAIFFGPITCGWVCPFGTFQEWISKIGRKIFGKKHNNFVPKKLDQYLRFLRYVVLFIVIYQTIAFGKLVFQDIDPYYAIFNIWSSEITLTALFILGMIIFLSLFIERPFCKYACPYGAVLGIFNLFRIFKPRRNSETCINCKSCDKACPMNIKISSNKNVLDHQCISCLKCTSEDACPVTNTVDIFSRIIKRPKLKSIHLGVIVLSLVFSSIAVTSALGFWNTTSDKTPKTYNSGEFAGQSDPSDIRGSYTLGEISKSFNFPLSDLGNAFGIKDSSKFESFQCKELEILYSDLASQGKEIGTGSIRYFVALYKGLPINITQPTYLLKPGVDILKEKAHLTNEQIKSIEQYSVDLPK